MESFTRIKFGFESVVAARADLRGKEFVALVRELHVVRRVVAYLSTNPFCIQMDYSKFIGDSFLFLLQSPSQVSLPIHPKDTEDLDRIFELESGRSYIIIKDADRGRRVYEPMSGSSTSPTNFQGHQSKSVK